jgi:hypothetical protein
MKKLEFKTLQKFMSKHSTVRHYSTVFKVEDSKLVWTDAFSLLMAPSFGFAEGLYRIDGTPANNVQYPRYKEIIVMKGLSFELFKVVKFAQAVKANPKFNPCIKDGELHLDIVKDGVMLERANMAVTLGCSKCLYYPESKFYVFENASGDVKLYVPGLSG